MSKGRRQSALLNSNASSKQDNTLQTSSLRGGGMPIEGRPWPCRGCPIGRTGGAVMKDPLSWEIMIIINKRW